MKFLLWAVIIFLAVAWLMRGKKGVGDKPAGQHRTNKPSHILPPETMLQCVKCGVYIPASEAVTHSSQIVFCSEEHRRQTFPS